MGHTGTLRSMPGSCSTSRPGGNRDKFGLINLLHINFYEEALDPEDVKRGISHARVLIDAMREAESRLV